mmetsp:Transcript_7976/g.23626  ORF Transcript_7976/g.23626 Transcript_7976/m.23626 type:complete len:256 (-) Transcript_7976:46-813(-)
MRPGSVERDTTNRWGLSAEWSPSNSRRSFTARSCAVNARRRQNQALQKADAALPSGSPTPSNAFEGYAVAFTSAWSKWTKGTRPCSVMMSTAISGVATASPIKGKSTSPGQCGGTSCWARSRHGPGGTTPPLTRSSFSLGNGYRAPFSTSSSASISPQAMFSTDTVRLCLTQNSCAALRGSSWRLARSSCILPFTSTSTTNSGAARAPAMTRRTRPRITACVMGCPLSAVVFPAMPWRSGSPVPRKCKGIYASRA